jgi:hypothetical protein
LAQIILGGRGFKFVQMKGIVLLQVEMIVNILKNLLLQNQQAKFSQTVQIIVG